MSRVKSMAFVGMQVSGLASLYSAARRPAGAIVLMYHSVTRPEEVSLIDPANGVPAAVFEQQMRFLARRRKVVSMRELVRAIECGEPIAPGTVAITFDDGYTNNIEVAAPILVKYGLPATLYIPTSLVQRAENQWIDRLYITVVSRTRHQLRLPSGGTYHLSDSNGRCAAYRSLIGILMRSDREGRETLLGLLRDQLSPSGCQGRLTMTWDEVRAWKAHPGLDVGVHTMEHVDLSSSDDAVVEREIRGCISDASRELGGAPEHFSFPYGRSSERARALVREAGLRSAVATSPEIRVGAGTEVYRMPRVAAPVSPTLFKFMTSPAYPALPRSLVGRA